MVRTTLVAVLAALLLLGAAPAGATTSQYGHTGSRDRVLRHGCHDYRYHYVVKAPTGDWMLETFLVDPDGQRLSSGVFSSASEPRRGYSHFRICRYSTRPGRFTIRARLHWYNATDTFKARFDPSHFRLRRA